MSERPEREWAAAKAMYYEDCGGDIYNLAPGSEELQRWLRLARVGLEAAEEYSERLAGAHY